MTLLLVLSSLSDFETCLKKELLLVSFFTNFLEFHIQISVISQKHIEAVSDKLTADKLASIKTKIRTRRRNQIADTDILSGKSLNIRFLLQSR